MNRIPLLALADGLAALVAFGAIGFAEGQVYTEDSFAMGVGFVLLIASAVAALRRRARRIETGLTLAGTLMVALPLLHDLGFAFARPSHGAFIAMFVAVWLGAWRVANAVIVATTPRGPLRMLAGLAAPIIFGATLLFLWDCGTRGFSAPRTVLPPSSTIGTRLAHSPPTPDPTGATVQAGARR